MCRQQWIMRRDDRQLIWFRNQLRLHDQPLFEGRERPGRVTVGVWILDPREHLQEMDGFSRSSARKLQFLLESVSSLRTRLRSIGTELIIRVGHPEEILPGLLKELKATSVAAICQPGTEERAVEDRLSGSLGERWVPLKHETILEIEDLEYFVSELPEVFSRFRRTAEKKLKLLEPRPAPDTLECLELPDGFDIGSVPDLDELGYERPELDDRGVLEFRGGELEGLSRLDSWMFEHDRLRRYKETRNGMLGEAYSSKFSPWLANGSLSSRFVIQETLRYEAERTANDSTYWLRFELYWREYFRLYLLKHGTTLFQRGGPVESELVWSNPAGHFEAWRDGCTGVPLVDANMIELKQTGFMSNRGRQIVASFLSKNLDVDWRLGAEWFEHCLVDYCPSANWGNWAYAAGVGADPRGFRGFDIDRQARSYDPDGRYVSHWLGEERAASMNASRHPLWEEAGVAPIVDPSVSLAAARRRWQQASA